MFFEPLRTCLVRKLHALSLKGWSRARGAALELRGHRWAYHGQVSSRPPGWCSETPEGDPGDGLRVKGVAPLRDTGETTTRQ